MMYDLASLTKPLVTAPLALAFLDLDADRRWSLGFHDRAEPLTVRQLLSHSAGLPPWRPFTGERVADQLRRPVPEAPLLRSAKVGESTYSDLGYRLLAELLEAELGLPWRRMGLASGLSPCPWSPAPFVLPDGRDREAWSLATDRPFPAQGLGLPHDANARAGMVGHAGFGATAPQLRAALHAWVGADWPARMAEPTARAADGTAWGLGLIRAPRGTGRFAELLLRVPKGTGVRVLEDAAVDLPEPAPALGPAGEPTGWWFHTGYTGVLLCVRPEDGTALALLCHRGGPDGALLDDEALRARRWALLSRLVATLGG
jgi:CubicO group peptidase (beta-lactamase class C family)